MKRRIFNLAVMAAKQSRSRFRLGAVVFRGASVYGIGCNDMSGSHPKARTEDHRPHAEFRAMISAGEDRVRGSRLFVVRLRRDGSIGNARPCPHCYEQAMAAGIKRIEWSE